MTAQAKSPTVKTVVMHAETISRAAQKLREKDPFANPWYPTTASARRQYTRELAKLQAEAQERSVAAVVAGDEPEEPDDAELEAEAARRAIAWMDQRFAREQVEYREAEENARRARNRHRRRAAEGAADREAQRQGLTPGQRIDQALAILSAISNAPVAGVDSDRVSGGFSADGPGQLASAMRFPGDAAGRARHLVIECVRAVEQEAEEAKRRMVELERAG